jgi:hypothetical protein
MLYYIIQYGFLPRGGKASGGGFHLPTFKQSSVAKYSQATSWCEVFPSALPIFRINRGQSK